MVRSALSPGRSEVDVVPAGDPPSDFLLGDDPQQRDRETGQKRRSHAAARGRGPRFTEQLRLPLALDARGQGGRLRRSKRRQSGSAIRRLGPHVASKGERELG
jgi:hypothetical protein